ncbi:ArsB/NhaD family transporter [Candidatus Bipolaricaulota bacterium]|nr:ArsB/NhaD family transporter [Candidatus Bipolaricaulota bacterium]
MSLDLLLSASIFLATYVAILTNKIERSLAAVTGGTLMVVAGLFLGFYTEKEVITEAIDWNTIGLLLGMMIVVGILKDTGLFETLAIWAAKLSRGDYFYMILLFGLLAAVMSTTIDNVTTIMLVAPISMSISSVLGIDPKPILLTQALFSNIGGVATLVGDPPNIMISSAGGFHYLDYIYNLAPTVAICTVVTVIVFKFIFSEKSKQENQKIHKKALNDIMERKASQEISDWSLLSKSLVGLVFIIVLFILHSLVTITPATVALTGAALTLILTQPDMDEILDRVEWSTLLFFAGLFVVVHGVTNTGLLTKIAQGVLHLTSGSLLLSAMTILFVTALGSGLVDNIPFTAAMLPIVGTLSAKLTGGDSNILWWALAFGAGFGGNATYIGSSANVMIVKLSEDHEEPISMKYWLKYGTVITLVTTMIAGTIIAIQILSPLDLALFPH